MKSIINQQLTGSTGKPVLVDLYWEETLTNLPIVLFCHGFKGFKDWGHWEIIAKEFVQAGYCFVKFNFSHNGTTPDTPLDFSDLEAFGQNNYTKEKGDLQTVLDWIQSSKDLDNLPLQKSDITLIGHSRGGPIALLGATLYPTVKRVVTWAGVHQLDYAWQKPDFDLPAWKDNGVYYVLNGRTKQQMPLYYQLYQDYQANKALFSTPNILKNLSIPYLIVHGTDDPAVSVDAAHFLHQNSTNSTLKLIKDGNHVFGGRHPFEASELPQKSKQLVAETIRFIKNT